MIQICWLALLLNYDIFEMCSIRKHFVVAVARLRRDYTYMHQCTHTRKTPALITRKPAVVHVQVHDFH